MGPQLGRIGIDSQPLQLWMSAYHAWLLVLTNTGGLHQMHAVRFHCALNTPGTFILLCPRPELRQEHPLNLSISISGGKETNQDAPSNGE